MSKLKDKILNALKRAKQLKETLNEISKSKENLLKNHSNPVFSQKDKNKILKEYVDLQNIEKSLQRYDKLKEYNYTKDAQEEKENIETALFKGYVNYYTWHAEEDEHTCERCKELDGQKFDFYDEVPERPHPNCKCTVEVVEDNAAGINPETYQEENDNTDEPDTQNQNPQPEYTPPQQNPAPANSKGWIMPCNGPLRSGFGKRVAPVPGASEYHNGWDIGVPMDTPIQAIANGKVIACEPARGYGNWVLIDHGIINGIRITSEYGHLSSWNVYVGQQVKQGQVIAKSGNSGYSTGPHLHITIREGVYKGTAVNPDKYIKINF